MKVINGYTMKETANLQESQIVNMIEKECMEKGIKLLPNRPQKPTEPEKPTYEHDTILYEVQGLYLDEKEIAEKVRDLIKGHLYSRDYNWSYGSEYKYVQNEIEYIDVDSVRMFTKHKYDRLKPELEEWKEKHEKWEQDMDDYEQEMNEWEEIRDERNQIEQEIRGAVREARRFFDKQDEYVSYFFKYIELSENDFDVAFRFFEEAYPEASQYFTEDMEETLYSMFTEIDEEENNG